MNASRRGRPRAFDDEAVLDQAMQVFAVKGFSATSLDDLVGATGLNRPSLYNAFDAIRAMTPRPDNVLLITDGLPTQGKSRPSKTKVTNEERIEHFNDAVKRLPKGVPVNTILFPMEGDAFAAAGYWELAVQSKGAFITPSRDWP